MTIQREDVEKIAKADGLAYMTGGGTIVVGMPLDGEWILATGDDLGAVLDKIEEVDGEAWEGEGMTVRPYLTKEEVADEILDVVKASFDEHGHFAKLWDREELVVPPTAGPSV